MAVSNAQIVEFLLANTSMSDADIAAVMRANSIDPSQVAEATGSNVADIQARFDAVAPPVYEPPEPVYEPPVYESPAPPVVTPVTKTSTENVVDFLVRNPNASDADIVKTMKTFGVSPAQLATATGMKEGEISARVAATVSPGSSVTLGDTVIVPQYRTTGSGMDEQVGALESFATSKSNGDVNYKAPVGTPMQIYSADGQFVNTVETKKDLSFFGGIKDALKDPVVLAAVAAVTAGASGLFSGAPAGAEVLGSTVGSTAGTAAGTGLGTVADVVGMGGGTGLTGTAGGLGINAGVTSGLSGITVGGGLTGTGVLTGSGLGTTLLGTGTGLAGLTGTGLLSGSNLGTSLLGTTSTTPLVGTGVLSGSNLGAELLGTGANTAATVGGVTGLTNTANVGMGALNTGVTTGNIGLGNGALNTGVPSAPYTIPTTPVVPTTPTTPTTPVTPTTPPVVPPTTPPITLPAGLTPAMIQSILGLIGTTAVASSLTPSRTSTPTRTSIPTQGVPLNSEDYFKAIQANYNQIMPNVPRDVSTPLAAWYNSQYGA